MRVTYKHYRVDRETGDLLHYQRPHTKTNGVRVKPKFKPAERGGLTTCTLIDGETATVGHATCSEKDAFCYRIGREIAYGRALKRLEEQR